ncbi:MAG: hypothetical protein KAX80_10435, partial [Planctomycetes bacterium]|nr:hypothetical protein [Planctomycetota bacterium]
HTVAVEYDEATRITRAFVLTEADREQVGRDQRFRKLCSSIELKIDAQRAGLELALLLRNCRLFPHPARTPLTVYVGREATPARDAEVQLLNPEGAELSCGTTDEDGIACLMLPTDGRYPLGGRFEVKSAGETWEGEPIPASGVQGIYPGDLYALSFE